MSKRITIAAVLTLLASVAEAHPGHGATEPASLLHFLSEPDHVVLTCLAIATAIVSLAVLVRRHRRGRAEAAS